jgi:hypothetical protein
MVEDTWMAVYQHASLNPEFEGMANGFKERNFFEARKLVAD